MTIPIPIENIYYMLCYAWDKLDERDVVDVDAADFTKLADLFARVLISGTNHLLRRGFDRGYIAHREWTGRLRGKIRFDEAMRKGNTATAQLPCEFDELSYDVLHNRILKATMRRLVNLWRPSDDSPISEEHAKEADSLWRMLAEVRDIELSSRHFRRVQLHRNNYFYDFLLKICELIHDHLLVNEKTGESAFRDFRRDEVKMRAVFEKFVYNFYRIHTPYKVRRQDIHWRWEARDEASKKMLPKMQTDISITSGTGKMIIDCKYTAQVLKPHRDTEKLRSAHLYQMHAYMNNLPDAELAKLREIMLLYPTVGNSVKATYTDKGRRISVRTINLNQPHGEIHKDLMALVGPLGE